VLGDQPGLETQVIEALLNAYARSGAFIVAPCYWGLRGHPVLLARDLWPAVMALPAGAAPRDLLRERREEIHCVPVETDSILHDIDTLDDYRAQSANSETQSD